MNLLTNDNWVTQAKKYFTINDEVELDGNKYKLDYTLRDEFGNIIAYGYNVERYNVTEKEMFEEFCNLNSKGDNFTKAIFNNKNHDLNPIPFLVNKESIYHTEIGIIHHLPPKFISTKNINSLLDILIKNKEDSERKIRLELLDKEEDDNFITIQELRTKGASTEQIKKITDESLWFERDEHTIMPNENDNNQTSYKHFGKFARRVCVYFNNEKELVIKAEVSERTRIYGKDIDHSSFSYDTKYWIISKDGVPKESGPLANEKYQLLKNGNVDNPMNSSF